MTDRELLAKLKIDENLSAVEMREVLEKKKQGLLRKLNAVFGNPAKERELSEELSAVEELASRYSNRTTGGSEESGASSALLSNVTSDQGASMEDFSVETRELSQTKVEDEVPEPQGAKRELKILTQLMDYIHAGEFDKAVDLAIDTDPETVPTCYYVLGWIFDQSGYEGKNPQRAFEMYSRGVEKGVEACYLPAARCCYGGIGTEVNLDKAIEYYTKASFLEKETDEPERALGEIYAGLGRYDEMFTWYQLAISEQGNLQAVLQFAVAILKANMGPYYTDLAVGMLKSERVAEDLDAKKSAYLFLLEYYRDLERFDSSVRTDLLDITAFIADEGWAPCAALAAELYATGYAGKADQERAIHFYELAKKNGEEFDEEIFKAAVLKDRRIKRLAAMNEEPFDAAAAAAAYAEASKSGTGVLRIPEGFTVIKEDAFDSYRGTGLFKKNFFSRVELPESLIGIEDRAFQNIKGLKTVSIPGGVCELGESTFYDYGRKRAMVFDTLTIPGLVEEIPEHCFTGCQIGTLKVEEGVRKISSKAFAFCKIGNVELPQSLTDLASGDDASFYYGDISGELRVPRKFKPVVEKQSGTSIGSVKYY